MGLMPNQKIYTNIMPRKRLPKGEKKIPFTFMIEGKYLENQNIDEMKHIAYLLIIKFIKKNEKSI